MLETDSCIDVVELCALMQCLGFTVKSMDTSDVNVSQDSCPRTVVLNCQSSGLHVVLESAGLSCSCPASNQNNSSFWQVSGMTGGKRADKETGGTILGTLPKPHRERIAKELRELIGTIRDYIETDVERVKEKEGINKSVSMVELSTPEKIHLQIKSETPTRYRSLDTLTSAKDDVVMPLPAPGLLQKHKDEASSNDNKADCKDVQMCLRQSTYTISSTSPGSMRRRNKTSSPIHTQQNTILDSLIEAEKAAEDLRNKLSLVIREFTDEGKNDSSMSSLALDVSKISVLKGEKIQFASSPNLSGLGSLREVTKSRLKRFESASTSNLGPTKENISKLKRTPNMFKTKKESASVKDGKTSKLNSLFKSKIVTPVRVPKANSESVQSLSSSKKKFSHIKSTIPRPMKKE